MRAAAVVALVLAIGLPTCGQAEAADDFEVLPDVYGSCLPFNKSGDGSVRNDCLTSASIVNKADGSIYACEAHLVVSVEGLQLTSSVAYKKASCSLANGPSSRGANPSSVAYAGTYPPRHAIPGGVMAPVPVRIFWRAQRDQMGVDVCFDFIGFKTYSGCLDARLKQESSAPPEASPPPSSVSPPKPDGAAPRP